LLKFFGHSQEVQKALMSILSGIKIIEIEGISPAPFCGMHLADMGADVVVIERPDPPAFGDIGDATITKRGKRIVKLNLKDEANKAQLLDLIKQADGLIEGMRPGVMERLGLGPEVCHAVNPKLAYGRVTGWGQTGPLSQAAGHDINYIGLSGALWYAGKPGDPPFAPPTLLGDIAGGGLYLTIGMLATILNARETGKWDVIDASMVDGSAHMMNLVLSLKAYGGVEYERGKSVLDGPHWFDSYECSDGNFITIGSLEPKFYALLLQALDLSDDPLFKDQLDKKQWPAQKEKLAAIIKSKPREHWCNVMEGTDICFAPVLHPGEAAEHPHLKERGIYKNYNGNIEASPSPRFEKHENNPKRSNAIPSELKDILANWQDI